MSMTTLSNPFTLSICSFMMNEKDVVRNMLESIKKIQPDEVVVIDEHSTDGTIDIINHYLNIKEYNNQNFHNVKIIDGSLNNDYSGIRNLAISNVKSDMDWILFVDADEILDDNLIEGLTRKDDGSRNLLKWLENNQYDSMGIRRKNYIDGQFLEIFYPDHQSRLFKNIKDKDGNNIIKYVGNIHEQLTGRYPRA